MNIKKTAFMFPGQGSQALKMLASFKESDKTIKETFERSSEALGYDVWKLTQQGPLEKLNQTIYTQPVLLTVSVALWQLWCSQKGTVPQFLVGHSLGEYTAYTCGSSFRLEEAVKLVAQRGTYMQEAVACIKSAMAVIIGLSYEEVADICETVKGSDVASTSSFNTFDQVVISGHLEAVEKVMQQARKKGARIVKRLAISVPAHCELMKPAAYKLAAALESTVLKLPNIPVISNVYSIALSQVHAIKESLAMQLYQKVHWVRNIQYLLKQDVNCFVECGPSQVLTKLVQHIAPHGVKIVSIGDYKAFQKALAEC